MERCAQPGPGQRDPGLAGGLALDIGCGEGSDAIWLASRGWTVTAADFSAVALERAAARSRRAGADPVESAAIAGRILWEHHGFTAWAPKADTSGSNHQGHTPPADMIFTAAEVVANLDPALWRVDVAESRPRAATDPDGAVVALADAVVGARRR